MLNDEINITQGIEEIIHTDLPEESETDYTKADKTDLKINQTYLIVNKQEQKIESLVSQIGDRSQKTTTITQDIDGIESAVQDFEDLTRTVSGIKTVTISDGYPNENILELHIYGNNSVFDYLYPEDNLYPKNDLYPYGDSRIRFYNDNVDITIDLGIDEVLRSNTEAKDELFINAQGKVSLIRRVNANGTTKPTPAITELGELHFMLLEGDNTFEILNYNAPIEVKYAIKSTLTDIFATKVEMNSSITQTAEEINLEVSKKVDENEVISKINQSAEQITIEAAKIGLTAADVLNIISGNSINLTSKNITIASNNFNVDENGNMSCTNADISGTITSGNATINGGKITLNSSSYTAMAINSSKGVLKFDNNAIHANDSRGYGSVAIQYTDEPMIIVTNNTGSYAGDTTIVGNHIITGSITQTSLKENKKNFEKFEDGLDIVKGTEIYKYNLKNEKDESKKHIGFVIGENYKYSEEITSFENDGVDTYSMISVAYKAIQEQQEQIEQLQNEIKQLKGEE